MWPVLDTPRLQLRGWRSEDRGPFAALNADPEVMEWMPAVLTRAESDRTVDRIEAHFAQHGFGPWAVTHERRFLGFVGLLHTPFEAAFTPCVELLWRLSRASWGHGYASEAARAVVSFAFDALALHELVSFTVPGNTRSRAVMERLGMRRDPSGDFDHPQLPVGHPLRRHVLYRLRPANI
jgi:RimJ/RimL family protein N-acetyltransferase